jgi:hypothetical protein
MNEIVAILLTFGIFACNKEGNDSSIFYRDKYFPSETGSYKPMMLLKFFMK